MLFFLINTDSLSQDNGAASLDIDAASLDNGAPSLDNAAPSLDAEAASLDNGTPSLDNGAPSSDAEVASQAAMNLPRLKGQEGKPMIKEGRIMGERSVFTKKFKERAVELARNTKRKRACPRPRHKPGYAGTMDAGDEAE
jgi:hypothetical protein